MTELTIHLDDDVAAELHRRAQRHGVDDSALAGQSLAQVLREPDPYGFFGSGRSDSRMSERVDELLAEGFGADR